MLEKYYMYLKQEYQGDNIRQYFAADCIGLQRKKNVKADYFILQLNFFGTRNRINKERKGVLLIITNYYRYYDDDDDDHYINNYY